MLARLITVCRNSNDYLTLYSTQAPSDAFGKYYGKLFSIFSKLLKCKYFLGDI